jgi:aminopeptidase N
MSEPSDARFWFPCHDDQADKATAEMEVRVPAGYVGASNGRLLGTTVNTDGSVSWFWREDHQIATYLMCVTVSDFAIAEIPYVTARNDTIPLQYYVWHQDSAECAAYLPRVREMMVALGTLFGEYPFDKYGMTAIVPFTFGGMEHQTLTTMNRFDRTNDDVVVHELAHQWWGDLVTCGRWEDIWLNEGFATYAEALWKESTGGAPALRTVMAQKLHLGFGSWLGAPYDPVGQGFNLFADVVYNKGGWVLHMLRGVLGDSTFFHTLRTYRDRYTESTALTGDFRAVAEQVSGRDLGWFFDQWVYGVGWPTYALAWKVEGDTLLATVYQQQRSGWRSAYTMPLQLRALSVGHAATWTVWDSLRTQVFRLPAAFAPESVVLDPEGWVLKENGIAPAGVTEEPIPPAFRLDQNYPNPFNAGTRLRYGLAAGGDVRLSIVDLLGSEVAVLVAGRQEAGAYTIDLPLAGLATGVYFARLHAGGAVFTRKMLLLR